MTTATAKQTGAPRVNVTSLAGLLPSLLPAAARAARLGFDRRFQPWLAQQRWTDAAIQVYPGQAPTDKLSIDLHCALGAMDVALDPDQWPSLSLAAALPDAAMARDVAAALLAPVIAALGPVLPGLAVRALRRYPLPAVSACALPMLRIGDAELALVRVDAALAQVLETQLQAGTSAPLSRLAGLSMPARLRLFERPMAWQRLRALSAGDLVLCGAAGAPWPITLTFGTGVTMQAQAEVHPEQGRASVTGTPRLVEANALSGRHHALFEAGGIGDLQVPVAFEVDSARVSLAELAALAPGSVIELDMPLLEAGVRLVCHGQTVGSGQLVAVGKQLGVRIERMGLNLGAEAGAGHDAAAQR
jgi:type III secretion protein Q